MMSMSPADLTKLAGVLGMLGSDHAGERDNAARLANRLVRGKGLEWADLLAPSALPQTVLQPNTTQPSYYPSHGWQAELHACLSRPDLLSIWEVDFCRTLRDRRLSPTPRQLEKLAEAFAKVRAAKPRSAR